MPRVLDDKEVVIAIINNNFAAKAGLDADQYGILREDANSPYVNVIVARINNKDQEKVKNFVKAYQSDNVVKVAEKIFKEGAIKDGSDFVLLRAINEITKRAIQLNSYKMEALI